MENKKVKIKDVVKLINGHPFKPTDRENSGMNIIRIQNLNNPLAIYNKTAKKVNKKYIVKKGDILISWSASLGVYEWKNDNAYLNQHIFKVEFISNKISKDYFRYVIELAIKELTYKMRGVGLKHLTKGQLDEYEFILPSIEFQEGINQKLNNLGNLINKRKSIISLLEEYLNSTFLLMFEEKMHNRKYSTLMELDKLVNSDKVITYGIVQAGTDIENGVPYIRSGDIKNGSINLDKLLKTTPEIAEKHKRSICNYGDIVMSIRATVGDCAIILSEDLIGVNLSRGAAIISPNREIVNHFYLYQLLKTNIFKYNLRKYIKGSTFKEISLLNLRKVKLPIHKDIKEQEKFGLFFEIINKLKKDNLKSLNVIEELYQSFLYNSFKEKTIKDDEIDKVMNDELEVETIIQDIKASDFESLTLYNASKDLLFKILERTEINNRFEKEASKFNKGIIQIYSKNKIEIKTNREHKLDN